MTRHHFIALAKAFADSKPAEGNATTFDQWHIRYMQRKAARVARRSNREPYVYDGNPDSVRLPFLGDYVPKGWTLTDRDQLFVDTSGFGSAGEPALTQKQMIASFKTGYGYALVEAGQFQGYVAEFERK